MMHGRQLRRVLGLGLLTVLIQPHRAGAQPAPVPAGGPGPVFNVKDYGAAADGTTPDTDAFRKAVEACNAAGGGTVLVPKGDYLTGPIRLLSNVNLHVAEGCTVRFSRNLADYPLVRTNWEGRDTYAAQSPLWGDRVQNVSITGPGTFDGNGDAWRVAKRATMPPAVWEKQIQSGGYVSSTQPDTWYPSRAAFDIQSSRGEIGRLQAQPLDGQQPAFEKFHDVLRPCLVMLSNAENVLLDGPTFRNSGSWNVHLLYCDDVVVRHVTLYNEPWAANGDGIDIDGCRNVELSHSKIYAGDDDICLKSGRDEQGRRAGRATENVSIHDCDVFWGHGGVTIGSEMSGGVRNVSVWNCTLRGTDIGLRFKSTRGRGGVVENVDVRNVDMHDIKGPAVLLDMYYMVKDRTATEPLSERTPTFRGFAFHNITCDGARSAIEIRGLPERLIQNIVLEGVRITSDRGATITDAEDVTLRDVRIESKTEPALQTNRTVRHLTLDRVTTVVTAPPTTQPAAADTP